MDPLPDPPGEPEPPVQTGPPLNNPISEPTDDPIASPSTSCIPGPLPVNQDMKFQGLNPNLDPMVGAAVSGFVGGAVAGAIIGKNPWSALAGGVAGAVANAILSQDGITPGQSGYVGALSGYMAHGRLTSRGFVAIGAETMIRHADGNPIARGIVGAGLAGYLGGGPLGAIAGSAGASATVITEKLIYGYD